MASLRTKLKNHDRKQYIHGISNKASNSQKPIQYEILKLLSQSRRYSQTYRFRILHAPKRNDESQKSYFQRCFRFDHAIPYRCQSSFRKQDNDRLKLKLDSYAMLHQKCA